MQAIIFPGQGSQKQNLLADFIDLGVEKKFAQASDILDFDLWEICQSEQINQTEYAQPAILTASVFLYDLIKNNCKPKVMAGHSLGEWSAYVCAGSLSFEDAVLLVHKRGLFMKQAVEGKTTLMAAVLGMTGEQVKLVCQNIKNAFAVNFNTPSQTVIAGEKQAVEDAMIMLKDEGAKRIIPLQVSVPSHCDLMLPAAKELSQALEGVTFSQTTIPVISNVDAQVKTSAQAIKKSLVEQLSQPVLWVDCV